MTEDRGGRNAGGAIAREAAPLFLEQSCSIEMPELQGQAVKLRTTLSPDHPSEYMAPSRKSALEGLLVALKIMLEGIRHPRAAI
jgi:hypothetical protein